MNVPNIYWANELYNWQCFEQYKKTRDVCEANPPGSTYRVGYRPARPVGFDGYMLITRIKLAWGVFTGKYDVLRWR